MIHWILGKLANHAGDIYIYSDQIGIKTNYIGKGSYSQKQEYFLSFINDDNQKTTVYYAFDHAEAKKSFDNLIKISGIGPKTAFQIANVDAKILTQKIRDFDYKWLESIPGIGPKTSKRILIELKSSIEKSDLDKINIDKKLLDNIVKSLKPMGYEASKIKSLLSNCPIILNTENTADIIQWLMKEY